jgi:hypothetical protein
MCGIEQTPLRAAFRLRARENQEPRGKAMDKGNDALWLAFEALAEKYPHDDGVRMTADLARWLGARPGNGKLAGLERAIER